MAGHFVYSDIVEQTRLEERLLLLLLFCYISSTEADLPL